MLQHSTVIYSISYIIWLQPAAEYGGCSQIILTSPLIITPLERKTRTLFTLPLMSTRTLWVGGNGLKRNHWQLQLLREDSCVIKVTQNMLIYSRTNYYAIVDMEDIRYTIRKGRYSDKQTTKRSFQIPALM